MEPNDLTADGLGLADKAALATLKVTPLDPAEPWDKMLLDEAEVLSSWAGVPGILARGEGRRTAAYPCNIVTIDRAQLERLFSGLEGDTLKTALFFALAHEFGHLAQYRHFGVDMTRRDLPRREVEAHADVLSGTWLGLRLSQGHPRLPEHAEAAALRLKSNTADYPSAEMRSMLVVAGQGAAAWVIGLIEQSNQIKGAKDYTRFADGLSAQDVKDLLNTARGTLRAFRGL